MSRNKTQSRSTSSSSSSSSSDAACATPTMDRSNISDVHTGEGLSALEKKRKLDAVLGTRKGTPPTASARNMGTKIYVNKNFCGEDLALVTLYGATFRLVEEFRVFTANFPKVTFRPM